MYYIEFQDELNAINGSINKWKDIIYRNGLDKMSDNCELCKHEESCYGCPIMMYTGRLTCENTPYHNWQQNSTFYRREKYYFIKNKQATNSANLMLSFLYEVRLFWINIYNKEN